MKIMMKMLPIIALLIMVTSCVTTTAPVVLPEKYNLDSDLTAVNRMSIYKVTNWDQVDNQSFIITIAGGKKYLIVLDTPLGGMTSNETIDIYGQDSSVISGYTKIFVRYATGTQYFVIEKIYEISSLEQLKKIREQLSNN